MNSRVVGVVRATVVLLIVAIGCTTLPTAGSTARRLPAFADLLGADNGVVVIGNPATCTLRTAPLAALSHVAKAASVPFTLVAVGVDTTPSNRMALESDFGALAVIEFGDTTWESGDWLGVGVGEAAVVIVRNGRPSAVVWGAPTGHTAVAVAALLGRPGT